MPLPGLLDTSRHRNVAIAAASNRYLHVNGGHDLSSSIRALVWRALIQPYGVTLLIVPTRKDAGFIINSIEEIILPLQLRITERATTSLRMEYNSQYNHRFIAAVVSGRAGRGLSVSNLFFLNADMMRQPTLQECWSTVIPTFCCSQVGSCIVTTTGDQLPDALGSFLIAPVIETFQ